MRIPFRSSLNRMSRLTAAATAAALLAVVTVAAQSTFETFDPGFEGELWEMVQTLAPPEEGGPVNGVVFTEANGYLYISDSGNGSVVVYDFDRNVVDLPDADWAIGQSEDSESPVYGWEPNQMATATVEIDGESGQQTAILVSDFAEGAHRVLAFTTAGTHLFTLGLDSSGIDSRDGFINGVAMGAGAKFIVEPNVRVQLIGSFAAAWSEGAREVGGAMAYYGTVGAPYEFTYDAGDDLTGAGDDRFEGSPVAVLTADEPVVGLPDAVPAVEPFGLTFDTLGNLYMTDSMTERLTAYSPGPNFTRLFTFGTPDPEDGGLTTIEFFQSYGIRFWPDAEGTDGRLFIADAINNRVVAYRPNLAGKTLDSIFELDGIGALDGFPYGLGIDPSSGRMAVGDDFGQQVWILKTPDLAAFDVRVLDEDGAPAEVVCVGATYTVRFSLTVPAGRNPVSDVAPQLIVDGTPTTAPAQPGQPGGYPSTPLEPGDVMTYSYQLTAPLSAGSVELEAGVDLASQGSSHVLNRQITLPVSSCLGAPPEIVATATPLPQLSGWTAVRPGVTPSVTLLATHPDGVLRIDYQVEGANHTIPLPPVYNSDPQLTEQTVEVALNLMGVTTVEYAAWNSNHVKSELQTLQLRLVQVDDRTNNEGDSITPFTVGEPASGSGVTFSATGLPGDLTINPTSGVISGALPFSSDSAGSYLVTVTESRAGDQPTSVSFNWTISDVNHAPFPIDDEYALDEDGILEVGGIGILANDTDQDGDTMTAELLEGPSFGTLTLNANGSFTYQPAADFNGTDWFKYRSNDGTTDSVIPAGVTITVNDVNDTPSFAVGTAPTVAEDAGPQTLANWVTAISAGPANESGQTVSFLVSNNNGALFTGQPAIAADGTLTFEAAANTSGTALVTVRAQDDGGGTSGTSAPQTFTITVTGVNDAPSFTRGADQDVTEDAGPQSVSAWATAISAGAGESSQTVSFVVSNDNAGLFTATGQPAVSPAGVLSYTAAPNASGFATITVTAHDNGGTANGGVDASAPQTFTITVNPANDPPTFTLGAAPTVLEDTGAQTLAGWVTAISAGPADESGQTVGFLVTTTNAGLFAQLPALAADGTLTYAPAADAFGTATVTVRLKDDGGIDNGGSDTSAPQQFTITVTGVNDAPGFTAGTVPAVTEDAGAQSLAWATAITAGALESAQTLTFVVSNDNNALFAVQPAVSPAGTLTYTPAANASGNATVTVHLEDNGGVLNGGVDTSASVTFTIAVMAVNDAPVATNDSYSTAAGSVLTVPAPGVLSGDTDAEGSVLTARLISGPSQGTLALNPDGSFAYTPAANFSGTVTFSYVANDGSADSAPATVTITVAASNLPPVCSATVSPGLLWPPNHKKVYLTLSGITDPDGDTLTIRFTSILQDEPTNGPGQGNTMQDGGIESNGKKAWVRAERSGTGDGRVYLISYTATDPDGASCTGQVTVGVPHDQRGTPPVLSPGRWDSLTGGLVTPPPAPVVVNDAATVAKGDDQDIAVLANDTDHGLSLTVSIVSQPAQGSATVNSNGTINYDAPSNWTGTTSFTYRVSNGFTTSAPATVTVIVTRPSPDDDDCGDRNHDHGRDNDGRDRDHRRGDHDRCKHGDRDRDNDRDNDRDRDRDKDRDRDRDRDRDKDRDRDRDRDNDRDRDSDDCGDRNHDHGRDSDNRERDHRRGDHDRCAHRR